MKNLFILSIICACFLSSCIVITGSRPESDEAYNSTPYTRNDNNQRSQRQQNNYSQNNEDPEYQNFDENNADEDNFDEDNNQKNDKVYDTSENRYLRYKVKNRKKWSRLENDSRDDYNYNHFNNYWGTYPYYSNYYPYSRFGFSYGLGGYPYYSPFAFSYGWDYPYYSPFAFSYGWGYPYYSSFYSYGWDVGWGLYLFSSPIYNTRNYNSRVRGARNLSNSPYYNNSTQRTNSNQRYNPNQRNNSNQRDNSTQRNNSYQQESRPSRSTNNFNSNSGGTRSFSGQSGSIRGRGN